MMEGSGSLLLQAGALTAITLAVIYIYIKSSYSYWTELGIPIYNPVVPFGNFYETFVKNTGLQALLPEFYKAFEGHKLGGLYGLTSRFLLVRDPDLIRDILVKDFDHFHDRGLSVNENGDPLQQHLFAMSGTKWRNLRVKLTPTFTSGKMKMMFGTLVDCGQKLKAVLREPARKGESFEVKDVLARFTTDVIASCAFGILCNCLENPDSEFRQWGRRIFSPTFKTRIFRFASLLMPSLIKRFGISLTPKDISNYFMEMVRETVEFREKNGVHRNDFMQLMIQLKNKTLTTADQDGGLYDGMEYKLGAVDDKELKVTMDIIAAQAFVFFVAGFETSSTTMTFCLYELALNPDIQERVRAEIDTVLQTHGGNITYEAMSEMDYLDKVVNETLRKYPPLQVLLRVCTKPYRLPGTDVTLEKGIRVLIPVMGLHYDPKYYPDPQLFHPERFSDAEKKKRTQYVYLPFGEGPRICIGMRFGLMQTKVGLVSILSGYEVRVSEETRVPVALDPKSFVTTPLGGMHLRITERSDGR